jgi:hypothetical protein
MIETVLDIITKRVNLLMKMIKRNKERRGMTIHKGRQKNREGFNREWSPSCSRGRRRGGHNLTDLVI